MGMQKDCQRSICAIHWTQADDLVVVDASVFTSSSRKLNPMFKAVKSAIGRWLLQLSALSRFTNTHAASCPRYYPIEIRLRLPLPRVALSVVFDLCLVRPSGISASPQVLRSVDPKVRIRASHVAKQHFNCDDWLAKSIIEP
jgi:hypothetical protein